MKAYYFSEESRKLRFNDNRPIVIGETHSVDGEIIPCKNGLHGSTNLIDALSYAPGPILYLVELSGTIVEQEDKVAAQHRTYLKEIDATKILSKFARMQALTVVERIKPYCIPEDYNLLLSWLNTGNEGIHQVARSTALAAAEAVEAAVGVATRSAALAATELAAWATAWATTKAASWAAARSAALAAVSSATRSAALAAARSAAEPVSTVNYMLVSLFEDKSMEK